MAHPGSILGQIGESFETIGQDVVRETVQAPKDIAKDMVGLALESLGGSSGKKSGKNQAASGTVASTGTPPSPEVQQEDANKRAIARAALQALSGGGKPKELSVYEQKMKEEREKKEMEKKQREEAKKKELPMPASKRARGDLFGKKAKQTQIESKAKRQD